MSPLLLETRTLVRLAWPVSLAQMAQMSMQLVDTAMVGRVSGDAMAAVSLGGWWGFAIAIFGFGMMRGIDPIVAQAHGAGDDRAIGTALARGVALAVLLAVPAGILVMLGEQGLRLLGQPPELLAMAGQYARVFALGVPAFLLFSIVRGVLQGQEIVRPTTIVIVAANIVNAAVNYCLIFGNFGFPALGVQGAAFATVISTWFQLGLLVLLTRKQLARGWPGWRAGFALGPLLETARMGLPQGFQVASEVWSFLVAGFIIGTFGAAAVGGHTITMQLASVSFMIPLGVSVAAATRVGNLIGAGLPWRDAAVAAHLLGIGVMALSAGLFALFPAQLAALFTTDPAVIALAITFLPIAAAFQLFDGTQVVAFGVLRGAGDQTVPAIANVVGYWLLGLPIGAWLAIGAGWGPIGLWVGLALALAAVAILLLVRERWTMKRGGFRIGMQS